MRLSFPWAAAGAIGACLLALPLGALTPSRFGAQTGAALQPWAVRLPSTPFQVANREAGFWWAAAIQAAADEEEEARAALHAWDPAAPFDADEARRRSLALDRGGYAARALAAVRRAGRLART